MKDRALEIARSEASEPLRKNKLREYLQNVILRALFELDFLEDLVFHGGTALRFLHGLERFSEDLDFHTREHDAMNALVPTLEDLQSELTYQGYDVSFSNPSPNPVKNSFLKFSGLLHEVGLSDHPDEKLRIKLEIDTKPPMGFRTETSPINEFFPYVVHHHDRPSFLAGIMHAILERDWEKGRDFFDLWFFLSRWDDTEPNLEYLKNALRQTDYEGEEVTAENWRRVVADRVRSVNWKAIKQDVEPFCLRPSDLKAFRQDLLIDKLLSGK